MSDLKLLTDERLVELYSKGGNKAFSELLSRHQSNIYSYILFLVRNVTVAEDLLQDTFLKVITTIKQGRYNEAGKFAAWITRIAHNVIIDYYRQERTENTVSNDDVEWDLFNDSDLAEDNIETTMSNRQVLLDVRRLVEILPAEQKEVIFMRYYQDLSFREIADVTGVSINTALGRMHYATLNLRRLAEKFHISLELS